ncbi:uncharacterized protein LOC123560799 [Mercenaria mercenaria]|uniref:uncharacterized protein LOC123560799 n=1 Tax=Mercenaria mercenaria TaxID=6596 RepID=UPI00234EE07D|nr:uncharacterized protein LOC123560799 [Mercenaria mercenaria]
MLFVLSIIVFLSVSTVAAQDCHDIDPAACQMMANQRPDLCSDETIAKTACPQFCKKCPVTCYHCNATVKDYHLCNTTTACPEGQMCMRKELKSAIDGHHEYEMTCAEKQACDDPWSGLSAFGKRDMVSRDVSVTCCSDDLCNYPEPPTTPGTTTTRSTFTGCIRDLVLIVDESTSVKRYHSEINRFLHDVVAPLPVNDAEVHVSLGLFATASRTIFDLDDLHSKSAVLHALGSQTLHGGTGDVDEGLKYAVNHALTPAAGDRPSAKNVVIIITDDGTKNRALLTSLEHAVHSKADVISIEIGSVLFAHLASDTHNAFHLLLPTSLSQIAKKVSDLVCS